MNLKRIIFFVMLVAMQCVFISANAADENGYEIKLNADKTSQWTSQEAKQNYSLRVHGWHEWENAAYMGFTLPEDLDFGDIIEALLVVNTTSYKNSGEGYIYSAQYSDFVNGTQYEGNENIPQYDETEIKSFTTPNRVGDFTIDITDYVNTISTEINNIAFRIDVKSLDTNNAWASARVQTELLRN